MGIPKRKVRDQVLAIISSYKGPIKAKTLQKRAYALGISESEWRAAFWMLVGANRVTLTPNRKALLIR
jgi:hypothetical protein